MDKRGLRKQAPFSCPKVFLTFPIFPVLYDSIGVMQMEISDIIARADGLKPNKYTTAAKLDWINHVDGMVWNEIYKHTGFADVLRQANTAAYDLPEGINFEQITNVYIDGKDIYKISHRDFETTGYYRGTDGKLNIYPVPNEDDTSPKMRIAYRLPFTPHEDDTEDVFIPSPYDKAYDDYLMAMFCKFNDDMDGYNNYTAFYNNDIKEYADWYNDHKQEE